MIVCLCHGISERTLKHVIEEGADTLHAVQKRCGAGGDCGSCKLQIANLIDAVEAKRKDDPCWSLPVLQTG